MKKDTIKTIIIGAIIGLILGTFFLFILPGMMKYKNKDEAGSTQAVTEALADNNAGSEETGNTALPDENVTNGETANTDGSGTDNEAANAGTTASNYPAWDAGATYNGGDKVVYQNKVYKAKWWTQNETPGQAEVWEDTMETPVAADNTDSEEASEPVVAERDYTAPENFKVCGYYPSWKPGDLNKIRYDVLTHIIYAFAIPTNDGKLLPLDNADAAKKIIKSAHKSDCKVLLAIGGWSYNDVPLEATFVAATETAEKRATFVQEILKMCDDYGFDGIDMDWEHPRVDGNSGKQYEALMVELSEELHKRGKVLTSAVISGATADGNTFYDAAAHSDAVLNAVDWLHVMAYDGGDGERHSQYDFAVNSGKYWHETRGLPSSKVVLGVPFYARPSWESYENILAANGDAWKKDNVTYNGMEVWLNSADTIQKKTIYALDNLGGVMIWEITQDTTDKEKSLMTAIKEAIASKN